MSEQELATSQLKQDLIRVTLAKQTLEYEKKELLRRVDELERGLAGVKSENGEKDKLITRHKQQLEEFARKQRDFNLAASAAGVSASKTFYIIHLFHTAEKPDKWAKKWSELLICVFGI